MLQKTQFFNMILIIKLRIMLKLNMTSITTFFHDYCFDYKLLRTQYTCIVPPLSEDSSETSLKRD